MSEMPGALLLLKVSVVLAAALVAARLSRRAPASARHRLWSGVFIAVLALPLLSTALPILHVPIPAWFSDSTGVGEPPGAIVPMPSILEQAQVVPLSATSLEMPQPPAVEDEASAPFSPPWTMLLAGWWLAGTAIAVAALTLALFRAARLSRSAVEITDAAWRKSASALAFRLGLRGRPRLLTSPRVTTPMAGGLARPAIFLPMSALEWDADRRDIVLAHEIAHLAGRDPLRQILTRIALAVYWFHPLVWMAARHAAVAREQACDEAVIALGTRRSTYARVLLEFADTMQPSMAGIAALPIVQRTLLEKRLMAILDNNARPATRLVLMPAAAVALLTLSVAAAQPASSDRVSGNIAQAIATGSGAGPGEGAGAGSGQGVGGGIGSGMGSGSGAEVASGIPGGEIATAGGGGVAGGAAGGVVGDANAGVELAQTRAIAGTDSACAFESGGSFSGRISSSQRGAGVVVHERMGRTDDLHVIQKTFGDVRVCMLAEGLGDRAGLPSEWPARGSRVTLETQQGSAVHRMDIAGGRTTWSIDGSERPLDSNAAAWRDALLAVLDPSWELSTLRGRHSSLRGEISSIHGQRSSLRGEISSLRGQISSMRGRISSIQGEESSLRGQISSIQGHLSSLRGAISSEQGAISSLRASRWDSEAARRGNIEERIREHEKAIARIEAEIRAYNAEARIKEVEREIARHATEARVAEVEKQIREFNVDARVAEVEKRIAALDVEGKVAAIEREITALEVDRRSRDLEARIDAAVKRLQDALGRVR